MAMDDEIKFRCDTDLAQRFERIAILERRKASDLARLVFEDYINHQERKLGLTHYGLHDSNSDPGQREAERAVDGAHAVAVHGATNVPPAATAGTSYSPARRSKKKRAT